MKKLPGKENSLFRFGRGIILGLSLAALLWMTISLLFRYGYMILNREERLIFQTPSLQMYVLTAVLLALLLLVRPLLEKVPERGLFWSLMALYLVLGCLLVANTPPVLREDNLAVYNIAENLRAGDDSDFMDPESDLLEYPHQLGLAVYEMLLMHISGDVRMMLAVNLLWLLLTLWLLWKTQRLLVQDSLQRKYGLLFLFAFLPQLFYVLMLYGEIPGGLMLTLSLYWACLGWKRKRYLWWIGSCVAIGVSCLIRKNFLIGAIALSILALLLAAQEKQRRAAVFAVLLMSGAIFVPRSVQLIYAAKTETDLAEYGVPPITFVTMGLQTNGIEKIDGWYNGYNTNTWRGYGYDTQAVAEQSAMDLEERLAEMRREPLETVRFFHNKETSMWCDPLFECIWSGPLEDYGQHTTAAWMQNLYQGGSAYEALYVGMYALLLVSYGMILLELFHGLRGWHGQPAWALFGILYFWGAFLFHMVWEASGQYVYINLPYLMPAAGCGCARVAAWLEKHRNQRKAAIQPKN